MEEGSLVRELVMASSHHAADITAHHGLADMGAEVMVDPPTTYEELMWLVIHFEDWVLWEDELNEG